MKNLIENQKDSFILYTSFYELYFEELNNEEKGILIDAIFQYVQTGRTDFEEINRDRGLKISFKTMVDQIQRNIVKYNDIREKRQKAARDRWSKKQTGDSRTIEMPGDSALVMRGKISNMRKDISEFISRTGYTDFDAITNGLQNSDLILLAARPGVGKTSFAMNIVNYAATKGKKKCAVFSLEMPKTQIAQRSLFSVANVSMEKGLKGELSVDEWKSLWAAKKELAESGIYVDDSSMNKATDILSKCRRLKREKGLDLVMIDYLQLMTGSSKNSSENRQQEISEITRSLKIAARELDVPIILLSQLSRAVESRKDHRPMLSDLRESGAIEQDADIVLFIYKPDMYNDVVNEDEPNTCEVIIAKHRNGPIGTVKLKWIGEYTKFVNIKDYTKIARQNVQSSGSQEQDAPVLEPVQKVDLENMEDLW